MIQLFWDSWKLLFGFNVVYITFVAWHADKMCYIPFRLATPSGLSLLPDLATLPTGTQHQRPAPQAGHRDDVPHMTPLALPVGPGGGCAAGAVRETSSWMMLGQRHRLMDLTVCILAWSGTTWSSGLGISTIGSKGKGRSVTGYDNLAVGPCWLFHV